MNWIYAVAGFLLGYMLVGPILYGIVQPAIPGLNITANTFNLLVGILVGYQAGKS